VLPLSLTISLELTKHIDVSPYGHAPMHDYAPKVQF